MNSRVLDFLFVLALLVIATSGTMLMVYALWHIGQRIMRATHTLLTCWEFHRDDEAKRRLFLDDPVMQDILAMRSAFRRVFAPFMRHSQELRRLYRYRYEKSRDLAAQMIWDERLGALLTGDEYDFLYGPPEPPADGIVPAPLKPVRPPELAAAKA